jgi:hypothetical protein
MKKLVSLFITAVFLALAVGMVPALTPTAVAQQAENRVGAQFSTYLIYDSPEDTFTNGEVTVRKEWHANMGSGMPVPGLSLTLDSTLNFDHIMKENLTTTGPPTYVWSFGDVPQGTGRQAYVGFGSLGSPGVVPVSFTPGFDASRSADKTVFTAQDTQALTIAVTPREVTEQLGILIFADENDLVNPVITSPSSGDGIELRQEGHQLVISPAGLALNTTWTITITIQVTPKMPEVEYLPYIAIGWRESIASSTASGNSLSLPVADMGTWIVSADGNYEWSWTDEIIWQVCWRSYSGKIGERHTPVAPLKGNHVVLGFGENMACLVSGDTYTNSAITGDRVWRITAVRNIDDETGAPVKNLKITLDSDMTFRGFSPPENMTTMGPPTYEWSFGDLVEESKHTGRYVDAMVMVPNYPSTVTPGLDASRSFDKTVFTAPGTQTLTITITPREEGLEQLSVVVAAREDDLIDPIISSYSSTTDAEDIKVTADKHVLYLGHIPVKLNTPLTITVTLQVTPQVPLVSYKPQIAVIPEKQMEADVGTTSGSSVSCTMPEVGTWTVSAEGDYVWDWAKGRGIGSQVMFNKMVVAGDGAEQRPETAPTASATTNQQVIICIAAGIIIIGLVMFFFIRRRRRGVVQ